MLAVIIVGLVAFNTYPVGVLHDDAVYVILAKSLATGQGYRYLNLPGAPAATHFPPGYPAVLAALWFLAPTLTLRVILFKLFNVALLGVIAARFQRLLNEQLCFGRKASALYAFLATASVPVIILTAVVMSETLFLAIVVAGLVVAERSMRDPNARASLILASVLAAASILVRTNGVAFALALALGFASERRWRHAGIAIACSAATLIPWQLWTSAHRASVPGVLQGAYGSYSAWIGHALHTLGPTFFAHVVVSNIHSITWTLSTAVLPVFRTAPRVAALLFTLALSAFGLRTLWIQARVTMLFTILYMGIVIVWPVEPARYLWGVWPLLLLFPLVGARDVWRTHASRPAFRYVRHAALTASACVLAGYLYGMGQGYWWRHWENIPRAGAVALRPMVVGIRQHAKPGEIIATPAEAAMYLYTNHQTLPVYTYQPTLLFRDLTLPEKAAALGDILSTYEATTVVTTSDAERDVVAAVNGATNLTFAPRDSFDGGVIFDVGHH